MKDALNTIAQAIKQAFADSFSKTVLWRFWHSYTGKKKFCYSTNKDTNNKYCAFVLSFRAQKWKVQKCVRFRLRWKAKDRAFKWFCEDQGKKFTSLHLSAKRKNNLQRVLICICNDGLEGYFDVDCEYLGQPHLNDNYLIEDRFGENRIIGRLFFREKKK